VRYVLEDSVRRVVDKVEINAQLNSTETGAQVWADRFEGERSSLGKLQVEVVARLANSLGAESVKAEALRAEPRAAPNNPDAVDLTMRGWAIVQDFKVLDPENASAMSGLAAALLARPYAGWSEDPQATWRARKGWQTPPWRLARMVGRYSSLRPDWPPLHPHPDRGEGVARRARGL
jgi:adenylate cyclase